jgi:hypothetical protein
MSEQGSFTNKANPGRKQSENLRGSRNTLTFAGVPSAAAFSDLAHAQEKIHAPVCFYLNYWEIPPAKMRARVTQMIAGLLDAQTLTKDSTLVSFVPWQSVESDINHSLLRFIQAVVEHKLKLSLIVTPELAVHYPYSGLPKDIVQKKDIIANAFDGQAFICAAPPVAFELPSFFSPDFEKRYSSFLSRMDSYFLELSKLHVDLFSQVTVIQTGSLWKYFRLPVATGSSAFFTQCWDHSPCAQAVYRKKIDSFFHEAEFGGSNRWKTHDKERLNHKLFFDAAEKSFRERSSDSIQKKSKVPVVHWELFSPEADPLFTFQHLLTAKRYPQIDYYQLTRFLDDVLVRSETNFQNVVHFSSMAGLGFYSEQQKQFLVLKAVLLALAVHGSVLFELSLWASFSSAFAAKVSSIVQYVQAGELAMHFHTLYWTPIMWEQPMIWQTLHAHVGPGSKMIRSLNCSKVKQLEFDLIVADPDVLITQESMNVLIALARAGKIVVVPNHKHITDNARAEMHQLSRDSHRITVQMGFEHEIAFVGAGKFVLYNLDHMHNENACKQFVQAVMSLAELSPLIQCNKEVSFLSLEHRQTSQILLFVMNPSAQPQQAQLRFPKSVQIKQLFSTHESHIKESSFFNDGDAHPLSTEKLTLQVPPFGIVPLNLDGINSVLIKEMHQANLLASEGVHSLQAAQDTQLPGFNPEADFSETLLWS